MKKMLSIVFLFTLILTLKTNIARSKDPIIVEVTTNFKTVKEALIATKTALMKQKFIPNGGMSESGFTATRTTGSKSDYYTADVMADQVGDKVKVTITLIKSGTGLLKLQKVADELKSTLGGDNSTGSTNTATGSNESVAGSPASTNSNDLQCNKFRKLKRVGIIGIVGGGALLGTALILDNTSQYGKAPKVAVLGGGVLTAGIILTIISGRQVNSICINNSNYHINLYGNSIGIAYNFSHKRKENDNSNSYYN